MAPMNVPSHPDMSRRSFLAMGAAGLAGAGLLLSGCGTGGRSGTRAFSTGPSTAGKPVRGGDLRVAMVGSGPAESLNVLSAFQPADIVRLYSLYDLLFIQGPRGTVKPGLVEHAVPNADASTWTLHLRRGVEWHDGKAFTADDVVYTIKHSWGSAKNVSNASLATVIDFAGVRKLDNYTVQVPLKLGVAQFPTITCIQQCLVVQDGTTNFANGIGTGPFKLQSFTPGSRSIFVANTKYWLHDQPYVDRLIVDSSFDNDQARLNALLANAADVVPGVAPALAAANATSGRVVIGNQPGPGFIAPVCRVDKGVYRDARVRRALKLIPDRDPYVNTVSDGYAVIGNDCPGFTNQFWASNLHREQDLDQARSLLKAAGHEKLNITLKTSAVVPGMVETATLYKQQALGAGVNVQIDQITPANYFTPAGGYLTRDFSTIFFTTGANSLPAFYLNSLVAGGPFSDSHWGDPGAPAFGTHNALLYDALAETDDAKAADKWNAVQRQLFDAGPYIVPANTNWVDAYSPNVRGAQTTPALNCDNYNFTGTWLSLS